MNLGKHIDKYNIDININITDTISVDIVMCLTILIAIIFFVRFIIYYQKCKAIKKYTGRVTGTFVSAEVYDSKINKNIKKTLIRYTINDKSIIKRMIIPKKQLIGETLNILYDIDNPNNSILIGDKTYIKKTWKNFVISVLFIILLFVYWFILK